MELKVAATGAIDPEKQVSWNMTDNTVGGYKSPNSQINTHVCTTLNVNGGVLAFLVIANSEVQVRQCC